MDVILLQKKFLIFLRDISNYQGNIDSIIIDNCLFTEDTLSSFLDHLNGIKSIKSIKYLEINDIPIRNQLQEPITRLLNSQNNFRCTKVSDSSLEANIVLNNSTLFDNKVEEIHFHKCTFLNTINQIDNFYSINTLDFSQTKFTFESLKSLFDNIKLPICNVLLNNINVDNQSLIKFYEQISQYDFSFIKQFEFANNLVPTSLISNFFDFLSKMKNLIILDISSSLESTDQSLIEKISNLLFNFKNLLFFDF